MTAVFIFTPFGDHEILAAIAAMKEIPVMVVPNSSGAVAVMQLPEMQTLDWDISELVGDKDITDEASQVAKQMSIISPLGVVILRPKLFAVEPEEGGTIGQLTALKYYQGKADKEIPAGVIIANADDVIEELIFNRCKPQEVKGAIDAKMLGSEQTAAILARFAKQMGLDKGE